MILLAIKSDDWSIWLSSAEGAEYGGDGLIREESVEAEAQGEGTAAAGKARERGQPEEEVEEEEGSSVEQTPSEPEVQ